MAGDRPLRRIRRRIHDIEHQRRLIDEHVNFLSRLQEQLSSGALTPEQIPGILRSTCYIQAPDIPSALRIVARDRSRLDGEEAMLRQRASARQLFLRQHRSAMPHGTPSSLAGASSSSEIETWVPEHVVEASSSELGGTSKDPTLTLNDTPHTLESADELPEHVLEVSSSELGGTIKGLSKFETLTLNDTPHTLESAGRKNKLGRFYPLDFQGSIEFFEKQDEERAQLFQARGYWPLDYQANTQYADKQAEKQTQSVEARGQHTYASKKEEVAANAKRWMSEEAMEAFRRYIESKDDLKGLDYEFGELVHQCFHVEHYFKIFHHFNFTAKTKMPGSTDWTSSVYFAQVKSICMIKRYACYPLEQDQYGECYACESQGMGELRHPLKGIYDLGRESSGECYACESQGMGELRHPLKGIYNLGREDIQPPFYYEDSDSDEFDSTTGRSESSGDDMS